MRHEGLTQDILQQATQCDIQHALSQFAFCAIRYTHYSTVEQRQQHEMFLMLIATMIKMLLICHCDVGLCK